MDSIKAVLLHNGKNSYSFLFFDYELNKLSPFPSGEEEN